MRRRVEFFVVETATGGVEMRRIGRPTRRNEVSTESGFFLALRERSGDGAQHSDWVVRGADTSFAG